MNEQLSLFDDIPQEDTLKTIDNEEPLKNIAFLYTATECGNNSGIRFMMNINDAMKFCEHPKKPRSSARNTLGFFLYQCLQFPAFS